MAASGQRTLARALEKGAFDPAYYFHGDEDFLKEKAVRQLIAAAVDPATRDFNLEVRRAGELDAADLASILATPPMMAERRVVVIRDVAALRKDARAALDAHLASPPADLVLVLVAASGGKADRALSARCTEVEFAAIAPHLVPKWIVQHARSEMDATITSGAAELLHQSVGADLPQLVAELDKLISFTGGNTIDVSAVASVVGVRPGETVSDLLDAIALRDPHRALRLAPQVLAQPKTSAVSIVMALAVQILAMAWARARIDAGASRSRIEGEFFGLLKETGAFPFRPWGDAVRSWSRALDRWTLAELDDALDALLNADAALKETRLSSDEQLLSTLILTLCGGARAAAA